MYQETFTLKILKVLSEYWTRVVSLDIETDTRDGQFLIGERILGLSLACRDEGYLTQSEGVSVATFVLEEDTDEAEMQMLQKVGEALDVVRPLGVLGYNHRSYDLPLLSMKLERYKKTIKPWKLVDLIQQSVPIDFIFVLRKMFKERSLRGVLQASELSDLPLVRQKNLISERFDDKAQDIYHLWMEDLDTFRYYIEGDALNILLIAEYIINEGRFNI
ncbi:MAG: hypothetical protein BAJATHORv1_120059 [Candidatus Thorarchaeota archaeon]|nr:MAG: hypothetical protein BAJATHORv1_120059 [Candidatus Thorarchaeota archaeon]